MLGLYCKLYVMINKLEDETGVETIEWIGLAAVVLVLLGAISTIFEGGGGKGVGTSITNTMSSWIDSLAGGG